MNTFSRRRFLGATSQSLLGLAAAGVATRAGFNPSERTKTSRIRLSLAAYSFREFFTGSADAKPVQPPERAMDMLKFIDYCAEQGCDGAELTSYYFPPNPTSEYLIRLRRRAFLRGVSISGTAIGNRFTHGILKGSDREEQRRQMELLKAWIDKAVVLGAPHIRVFAGDAGGMPREEAVLSVINALEEAGDYAGKKGVFLGLENHGGIVADSDTLLRIVESVKNRWVGINLDTGNFHTEDPWTDLAKCAPYAVNVQIKVEMKPKGGESQEADLPRIVKLLRDANYQGFAALEYEAKTDPFEAVPRHLKTLRELMAG